MIQAPPKIQPKMKVERRRKRIKEVKGELRQRCGKDAAVNVGTLRGEWERISTPHDPMTRPIHNRGRNPWERSPTPHGASDLDDIKKRDATSPSAPSETSTNVPSDDDGQEFLMSGTNGLNMKLNWTKSSLGRCSL